MHDKEEPEGNASREEEVDGEEDDDESDRLASVKAKVLDEFLFQSTSEEGDLFSDLPSPTAIAPPPPYLHPLPQTTGGGAPQVILATPQM